MDIVSRSVRSVVGNRLARALVVLTSNRSDGQGELLITGDLHLLLEFALMVEDSAGVKYERVGV